MKRVIEKTDDGSATLFVPELNEHYHSIKGARTESQHIFIHMGLEASDVPSPRILEIGFGTGLNAWLTLEEAERNHRNIHYTGLELYPLEWPIIEQLGYIEDSEQLTINNQPVTAIELFKQLHISPWEEEVCLSPHFTLRKVAPEKQPEMWSQELFNRLYVLLSNDGILTTYCAKGVIRRMLQTAGFVVERLPGPPGGKREILRARKQV